MADDHERRFRALLVKLECGHTAKIGTSFYRLTKDRVSGIFSDSVRAGEWCFQCKSGTMQVVEFLKVVPL